MQPLGVLEGGARERWNFGPTTVTGANPLERVSVPGET